MGLDLGCAVDDDDVTRGSRLAVVVVVAAAGTLRRRFRGSGWLGRSRREEVASAEGAGEALGVSQNM